MTAEYLEKLRDPRWQKLRLQVFERDGWGCCACGATDRTLNVHHLYYDRGNEPWEYPLRALRTLCEHCHGLEKKLRPAAEQWLVELLRREGVFAQDLQDLTQAIIERTERDMLVCLSALMFVMTNPEAFLVAVELFVRADGVEPRRRLCELGVSLIDPGDFEAEEMPEAYPMPC